jgi:hypothetical protein
MTILIAATVIVRIFALLIFIYLLGQIPSAYTYTFLSGGDYAFVPWLTTIPFFLISFVFWFFPMTIAKILLPSYLHELVLGKFNPNSIEQASITIIGLWLIVWSIPDGFNNMFAYLLYESGSPDRIDALGFLITTLIEFGLGLFLVIKSEGIYKILQRLRS